MLDRIFKNTFLSFYDRTTKRTLSIGENGDFPDIESIKGLDIPEIEREEVDRGLRDGKTIFNQRISSRTIEITGAWETASQRKLLKQFFTHKGVYDCTLTFDDKNYYQTCYLADTYEAEQNNGNLYHGSKFVLPIYFADPSFFTDILYEHVIGFTVEPTYSFNNGYMPSHQSFGLQQDPNIFIVNNPNSTENGFECTVKAINEKIVNPKITNLTSGFSMAFDIELEPGEWIYINTQDGQQQVLFNGTIDIAKFLRLGSFFIQLASGENQVLVSADDNASKTYAALKFRGRVVAI